METNRNNETKEFTIGTKIEYNGKLYEVVEQKFCYDCSLKNICPNNDVAKNDSNNLLSRDERINVFGECSPVKRKDHKSIIFKEISADDVYDIDVLYKNDKELLPIKINIPSGYTIDEEHSDLTNGIIRFKSKWLSIEDIYRLVKENDYLTYRSSIICFRDGKLIALANLMDIVRYFNGDWKYNITKGDVGYSIAYYKFVEAPHYSVCKIDNSVYTYYGSPVFKNEADAQYVIDNPNFRTILDKIFKV